MLFLLLFGWFGLCGIFVCVFWLLFFCLVVFFSSFVGFLFIGWLGFFKPFQTLKSQWNAMADSLA